MALSERVDLTENRDFAEHSDRSLDGSLLDLAAIASTRTHTLQLEMEAGEMSPSLKRIKIYPWNVFQMDEDPGLYGHYFSEDSLSNEMGFEVYGDVDYPFVLGNVSDRKVHKYILESEGGLHCDCCGKRYNIFDEIAFVFDKYYTIYTCKKCKARYIRQKYREDAFGNSSSSVL